MAIQSMLTDPMAPVGQPLTPQQRLLQLMQQTDPTAGGTATTGMGLSGGGVGPEAAGGLTPGPVDPNQAAWQKQNPGQAYPSAPQASAPGPNDLVPSSFTLPPGGVPGTNEYRPTIAQATAVSQGKTMDSTGQQVPGTGTQGIDAPSGYNSAGLDPNNPIDAVFLKNKYAQNGQGSGFGDLAYWRQHPDQAARLSADQLGTGTDTPGPGDAGNTSRDPNLGKSTGSGASGSGGGLINPLSFGASALPALSGSDPADSILSRIMTLLNSFGGGAGG